MRSRTEADQEASQRRHQQQLASWRELAAFLGREGWEANLTCVAAPVQMEGRLPSGERFYFRARRSDVSMGIGGDDPADIPAWEESEPRQEASWLPAAEGEAILRRLARAYAEQGEPDV